MFLKFVVSVVGGSAVAAVLLGGVVKILRSIQTKQDAPAPSKRSCVRTQLSLSQTPPSPGRRSHLSERIGKRFATAPASPTLATSDPSSAASSIASRPSATSSDYVSAPQPGPWSSHRHAQQPAPKTPTREKQTGHQLQLSSQTPPETT
jgi:hypothetical protein